MKILKTVLFAFALIFVSNFASAQKTEWKEQADFHKLISRTYHPAEAGDYKTIRRESGELVKKAEAWKNSEIPQSVKDKKMVKKDINQLYKQTKKLDRKIKKGAKDSELKDDLSNIHDTFHKIIGVKDSSEEHHEE